MSATERLPALDVLRGIAILGTLATNIWIFTHPEGLAGYIVGSFPIEGAWGLAEKILQQLSQGKFLGLLTLMFGIGLALQRRSAARTGRAWPGSYPLRAGLLFVDGVLHYLLVAEFDVLMGYAVTAVVVAWLLATSERSQRRWIIGATAVHLLLLSLIVLALAAMDAQSPPASLLSPNPYADGSWWDLVRLRIEYLPLFRFEPVFIFALSIALFLCGARLLEKGVLDALGGALRRRLMWLGALVLPVDLLIGVLGGDAGVMVSRYGTAPLVSLGLLAAVAEFYRRRPRTGFVGRRLSEVGRAALSCYMLQNLLASAICYGWGLGLSGALSAQTRVPATLALYLVVALSILAFAHVWLRRFQRGPVEWLWNESYRALGGRAAA